MSEPVTLVYGGTFDPPHVQHVRMASMAADAVGATRIRVIPAAMNPQRAGTPPSPAEHRMAMTRLAFAAEPRAVIDDVEIRRGGPSFTVDTLEALVQAHPGERLRLLIGGDQALNFGTWRRPERIIELAEPVVVPRPPLDAEALARELHSRLGAAARPWPSRILPIEPQPHASTSLREVLARGERPDAAHLAPAVTDYALRHGLYRGG
jgi:nicotinate-nucleotide adenylyltransferase